MKRLVLGTAQLGMPYGIANLAGQPQQNEARNIVSSAWEGGVEYFDTASSYGQSENILGNIFKHLNIHDTAKVITKLPGDLSGANGQILYRHILNSINVLGVNTIYTLMFHKEEHLALLGNDDICDALLLAVDNKQVLKMGVSVYSIDAAKEALQHPLVSVIQIPASLFDRRFEAAGIFDSAKKLQKEIHVRSVLLQGVLCMTPKDLPEYLSAMAPYLESFVSLCKDFQLPQGPAALAWAVKRYKDAFVLFGAETQKQVMANLDFFNNLTSVSRDFFAQADQICPPQESAPLNPSLWKL